MSDTVANFVFEGTSTVLCLQRRKKQWGRGFRGLCDSRKCQKPKLWHAHLRGLSYFSWSSKLLRNMWNSQHFKDVIRQREQRHRRTRSGFYRAWHKKMGSGVVGAGVVIDSRIQICSEADPENIIESLLICRVIAYTPDWEPASFSSVMSHSSNWCG